MVRGLGLVVEVLKKKGYSGKLPVAPTKQEEVPTDESHTPRNSNAVNHAAAGDKAAPMGGWPGDEHRGFGEF